MERQHHSKSNPKRTHYQNNGQTQPPGIINGDATVDTSKPTAIFKPRGPRDWTLSVAVPGSIIANAQTHDLKTSLAGQLARALAVFCVDEVIIFNDDDDDFHDISAKDETYTGFTDPSHFLIQILGYLETPPYLRKMLFPIHPNLRTAGTLPSLDMPHHLKSDEECLYREGVTISEITSSQKSEGGGEGGERKSKKRKKSRVVEEYRTVIDAGLSRKVVVDVSIPPNTRVTLKFNDTTGDTKGKVKEKDYIHAEAIHPSTPREESGYYWGYLTRRASSLSSIFTECPFEGEGYDLSIGTSERGIPIDELLPSITQPSISKNPTHPAKNEPEKKKKNKRFKHMILIIGGPAGLEAALIHDSKFRDIKEVKENGVAACFDHYVDLCNGLQGSRTIRSVEAVWIALARLKGIVDLNY
ncbi:MAG: hypothetical protein M1823_003144 [Watsoniomyces obsoletus]|nr:MAG: hypothetical protein M1823_003144 [Watsoniomyces obsoletus]